MPLRLHRSAKHDSRDDYRPSTSLGGVAASTPAVIARRSYVAAWPEANGGASIRHEEIRYSPASSGIRLGDMGLGSPGRVAHRRYFDMIYQLEAKTEAGSHISRDITMVGGDRRALYFFDDITRY